MRAATGVLAVLLLAGCGGHAPALAPGTRAVVMLSGRDDHGLLASQNLLLTSAPGAGAVVAPLPSGTLVDVLEVRGTRLKVTAFDETGWLDAFDTLGELRLAGRPPACTVKLGAAALPAGTRVEVLAQHGNRITVRLLDGSRQTGVVARSEVVDLPPSPGRRCPDLSSGRTR